MLVDLGETWSSPRYYEVTDTNGDLADAGTVTATITQTDGTTAAGTITHPSTGRYGVDFTPPMVDGRYDVMVSATGGALGTLIRKFPDTFTVTSKALLVSVDDALEFMRAQETITSYPDREYLRWLCLLATTSVEDDTKRALVRQVITEEHEACGTELVLNRTPVISVTSLSIDGGTAQDPTTYRLMSGGFVKSLTRWVGTTFGVITVSYLAGYANPPLCAVNMAKQLIARNWQQTQQKPHSYSDDASALQEFQPERALLTDADRRAYEGLYRMAIA
jgi:hypothetical protein